MYTVDVKKTFPKSFAVPPFNGVRTVKRQNGNGKRPFTVCPFPHANLSARVPLPLSLIGLRYNMEVAKRILTRSKAWERPIAPSTNCTQKEPSLSPPKFPAATSFRAPHELRSCRRERKRPNGGKAFRRKRANGATVNAVERWNGKRFWKRFFDVYCMYIVCTVHYNPIYIAFLRTLCAFLHKDF